MWWFNLESPVVKLKHVVPCVKEGNDLLPRALVAGMTSNSFPTVAISPKSFPREQARSRRRGRFELNPAAKVEFRVLLLVNGSYKLQVLSIIVRLHIIVLLCNLELRKETNQNLCSFSLQDPSPKKTK